jgi:hypothetical protein
MYHRLESHSSPSNDNRQVYVLLLSMFNDTLMTVTGYWVSALEIYKNRRIDLE